MTMIIIDSIYMIRSNIVIFARINKLNKLASRRIVECWGRVGPGVFANHSRNHCFSFSIKKEVSTISILNSEEEE